MPPPALPFTIISFLILSLLPALPALPVLPNPDPAAIQQQQFNPSPNPPATIPSFPEQSAISACPLHLPDQLFPAVRSSCSAPGQLYRSTCCPVLAAWLYAAYSQTALGRAKDKTTQTTSSNSYDMPLLPDDSETCVESLEKKMRDKGVDLVRPNATCDVVYCFCGIRLHPLSCPQAFSVSGDGRLSLVDADKVNKLERDCLTRNATGNHRYTALNGCSKCLNSLYKLKKGKSERGNTTKWDGRTSKMRSRDCELMGLTWLLNKDRDAYISTVTLVMRALMMDTEGSDPQSCSLSSDGMPLAVDSVEINGHSSSVALRFSLIMYLIAMLLLIMS